MAGHITGTQDPIVRKHKHWCHLTTKGRCTKKSFLCLIIPGKVPGSSHGNCHVNLIDVATFRLAAFRRIFFVRHSRLKSEKNQEVSSCLHQSLVNWQKFALSAYRQAFAIKTSSSHGNSGLLLGPYFAACSYILLCNCAQFHILKKCLYIVGWSCFLFLNWELSLNISFDVIQVVTQCVHVNGILM